MDTSLSLYRWVRTSGGGRLMTINGQMVGFAPGTATADGETAWEEEKTDARRVFMLTGNDANSAFHWQHQLETVLTHNERTNEQI